MPPAPHLLDLSRRALDPDALLTRPVPASLHDLRASAPGFQPDADTLAAVNAAIAVGAPLLVTGEPGTGKTQLAYYVAWIFGLLDPAKPVEDLPEWQRQPYALHVKSTSVARDLLYSFDTVAWFHDAYKTRELGAAAPKPDDHVKPGPLWRAFDTMAGKDGPAHPAVVLIDEIDKAPRDFPNDLLHELDQYALYCKETNTWVSRPRKLAPPLVILTSNSEQRLPEPFLRRCVFHHLELDEATVRKAVAARARDLMWEVELQAAALERFWELRGREDLRKRPSTGELLAWLTALTAAGKKASDLRGVPLRKLPLRTVLIKDRDDLKQLG